MPKLEEVLPQLHFPISAFPPEILSLVLQHACTIPNLKEKHGLPHLFLPPAPPVKNTSQFVLGAVSVQWRQVLLSTPEIWTTVDLTISRYMIDNACKILQLFFTRSGDLPLAIGIQFVRGADILANASFNTILHRNTHRIRGLYVSDASDAWMDLLPSLSKLVHLSTKNNSWRATPLTIKSHCSSLTLKSYTSLIQLSCSEITVLRLHDIPIDIGLKLLLECPGLIEYRNRLPTSSETKATLPTNPTVLPHMEIFEWSMNLTDSVDVALLQHIRMPALRELVWAEETYMRPSEFDMAGVEHNFFHNLPSTLTILHIHDSNVNLDPLPSVFDFVHGLLNVECLTVSSHGGRGLPDHVFEALTPDSEVAGGPQLMKLPKLKSLFIQGDAEPVNEYKLLQMLKRRYLNVDIVNLEPFLLEFGFKTSWKPEFKEKLEEMIGCGLKVRILENSKPVDWL